MNKQHKIPLRIFFDMSTAHITREDNKILGELCEDHSVSARFVEISGGPFYVESKDQGWVVVVFGETQITYYVRSKLLEFGFSLAFVDLIDLVLCWRQDNEEIRGLWLDADAPVINTLPTFDWETGKEISNAD